MLMKARKEGQLVAWSGCIENGLRVVAWLDLVFGREEGGCEEQGEKAQHGRT
jgi:hypothetical protein